MITLTDLLHNNKTSNIALETSDESLSYAQLQSKVENVALWLVKNDVSSVALLAQNSVDWVVVDLACHSLGIIITPLPLFFSKSQLHTILEEIEADLILSDTTIPYKLPLRFKDTNLHGAKLSRTTRSSTPTGTVKITFTSGTTGQPKGVCLSASNQLTVAQSLLESIGVEEARHLCLLPLPTLLENIAGVYAPLLSNGTVILANDAERGFEGSKLVNPSQLLSCISQHRPNTLILVPELLNVLIAAAKNGWVPPTSLIFIAVGGSRVSAKSITEARNLGLPVCQGYGLSECGSVVSLCSLEDDVTSAGTLLAHVKASVINEELVVTTNSFLGYLNAPDSHNPSAVNTGDIAHIENNTLYLSGRVKNTIINSYGRNISPEWIESELMATGLFLQTVVLGDARPFCTALLVPANKHVDIAQINERLNEMNKALPDYAQVFNPIILAVPMRFEEGLYTQNMRPRRAAILDYFSDEIEQVYSLSTALEA